MKILLLSAYDANSHRYWHEQLIQGLEQHEWTLLSLPARHFAWRFRGNSLYWALEHKETLKQGFDLILATSMVDLAGLKGMCPELANTPTVLYFHENQFAYPDSEHNKVSVEILMTSIYSAVAADRLIFNSKFNQDTFIQGVQGLLNKLPDFVPKSVVTSLLSKTGILPVPLRNSAYDLSQQSDKAKRKSLDIVWNHRWEYDKNPELLRDIMISFAKVNSEYKLHVVGQQFRKIPAAFDELKETIPEHIGSWGYVKERSEYQALLANADVVISTALHDFQGLSVLEGVAAGAVPMLPNRQAYPELFEPQYIYDSEDEMRAATEHLSSLAAQKFSGSLPPAPCIKRFSWDQLKPSYEELILETVKN